MPTCPVFASPVTFIFALIYTPLLCPHVLLSWSHVTEDLSTSLLYLSNQIS